MNEQEAWTRILEKEAQKKYVVSGHEFDGKQAALWLQDLDNAPHWFVLEELKMFQENFPVAVRNENRAQHASRTASAVAFIASLTVIILLLIQLH